MGKYFIIRFNEKGKKRELITEEFTLIPMILEIKHNNMDIICILDDQHNIYTLEYILQQEKKRLEELYKNIKDKNEIYNTAYSYLDDLKSKNLIYDKDYNMYIEKLNKILQHDLTVDETKEKIIQLFIE